MSPGQASVIMPVSVLFIFFALASLNIYIVKRKIGNWKKGSTFFFLNKIGGFQINRTASLWMSRLGYDKAEAVRLATWQLIAMLEILVCELALFMTAAHFQTH
jgi:hypothetical protein